MFVQSLKSINGHPINKSAEINQYTGKIKMDTVVYTVYTDDSGDAGFECFKTLKAAQKYAKSIGEG